MRLGVFAVGVVLLWFVFVKSQLSAWWLLPPAGLFAVLVVLHERAIRKKSSLERAAGFYEQGIARLNGTWSGQGMDGNEFLNPAHPYAADLDIFGKGSLFELLCIARTSIGRKRLAGWLLQPADQLTVEERQRSVAELRDEVDLREQLAIVGDEVAKQVHAKDLESWSASPAVEFRLWERLVAAALAASAVVTLTIAFPSLLRGFFSLSGVDATPFLGAVGVERIGALPFLITIGLEWLFTRYLRPRVDQVIREVERAGDELNVLADLLRLVETRRFESPLLSRLTSEMTTDGHRASDAIAKLGRLIDLLESRRNQFFFPFAAMLLWTTHMAFSIARWRSIHGARISAWLSSVAEMEALQCLAAHAFENAERPFPEIVPVSPRFVASALGHPLIPADRRVSNDVSIDEEIRLILISGSNMSGKSTFLRTVGMNAVLAFAGAPVCARSLQISPFQVGASIRINDSLQEGSSRFYAEITRLRQLVDLGQGTIPLLFLLDEILHGTNSHDRRIGAEAVVVSLVKAGAVGFVTTHDLALAKIADRVDLRAINVHFEDHIDNGRMVFDYRMRRGVVEKSNALELMKAVGLDVES